MIVSNRTVNVDLTYLSQCLKKAKQWRLIIENPCEYIPKLPINKGRTRFFSQEEIQLLLGNANLYLERFIRMGIYTGLRCGELLNLKISQIDFSNNVIHIVNDLDFQTKSRKNRDVPIASELKDDLIYYVKYWVNPQTMKSELRQDHQRIYLFNKENGSKIGTMKRSYYNLMKKLNIKEVTIHTMRHTFASHLVMSGASIRTIQDFLGHSSISVTERYAHLTNSHKQQALQGLHYLVPEENIVKPLSLPLERYEMALAV